MKSFLLKWLVLNLALSVVLVACVQQDRERRESEGFQILAGSEHQSIEPLIQEFAKQEDLTIEIDYAGSVDIMRELSRGSETTYDAVWPSSRMWISLGDTEGIIQDSASIMRSPVVLAIKRSVADELGWIDAEVSVDQILDAAEAGTLTFMMANASQSDSGASAYLGFLYAFAGHPDSLTSADLASPVVKDKIKRILGTVNRTAGSSGLLKDLFLAEYDTADGMVNYESTVIETNQALVASGREQLYAIYPIDGTAIADAPLAFIDQGNAEREATYQQLKQYLLSDDIQRDLLALGRRTGLGVNPDPTLVDPAIFNPEWGIDTQRILTPIKIPSGTIVSEALNLYQSALRKPSFTILLLDFSGSMATNNGEAELKEAMRLLLDQESAKSFLLQAAPDDVTIVIAFNDKLLAEWSVEGNDPDEFRSLVKEINVTSANGGTNFYGAVIRAMEIMQESGNTSGFSSIVLMTDGENTTGNSYDDVANAIAAQGGTSAPIFGILFGSASRGQLDELAALTSGAVFDGRGDLLGAFRIVRGYS